MAKHGKIGLKDTSSLAVLIAQRASRTFPVRMIDGHYFVESSTGQPFAVLDVRSGSMLRDIANMSTARFQVTFTSSLAAQEVPKKVPRQTATSPVEVLVNIYARGSQCKAIDRLLQKTDTFLQHPEAVDDGIDYVNPQYFMPFGSVPNMNHKINANNASPWSKILDMLDERHYDATCEVSEAVTTPLKRSAVFEIGLPRLCFWQTPENRIAFHSKQGSLRWVIS